MCAEEKEMSREYKMKEMIPPQASHTLAHLTMAIPIKGGPGSISGSLMRKLHFKKELLI